jgi:methylenetetrahydrofolate dehydrogenase (NADP+)/methenyltetrahydrofolate cyclohydrolase
MIDCKSIANKIKEELKPLVTEDKQLAIIQVGEDPASNIYCKMKIQDAEELGVIVHYYQFKEDSTNGDVLSKINELNRDEKIKGIIIQLPLPKHLNTELLTNAIVDEKDIDGFKVTSKYTPCTPKGIMTILGSLDMDLAGKSAVIIGKGKTVGKPLINLLLDCGVTVTVCHSRTTQVDLQRAIYYSDIVISAVGEPNLITKNMLVDPIGKIPPGIDRKVIIDVGISRDENGKQIGDVSKDVRDVVSDCTPYVNGCGLLTRCSIFDNLLRG